MRLITAITILLAASTCFAGQDWKRISGDNDAKTNTKLEIQVGALEQITATSVRAALRYSPLDDSRKMKMFDSSMTGVNKAEMVVEFDCRSRTSLITIFAITEGAKTVLADTSGQVPEKADKGTVFGTALDIACKL